jgi:D-sedoheptulose 7-phosphate isomerase
MLMMDYQALVSGGLASVESKLPGISSLIVKCIFDNNNIWIIGNGGSASTADHFATDLSFIKSTEIRHRVGAISLCSNTALLTAIANDIGFENVFAHQLGRLANKGDICIIISASGNSKNLLAAYNVASKLDLTCIALLGFDGGTLAKLVDHAVVVETPIGEYGPVEDVHLSICHQISAMVKSRLLQTS